MIHNSILVLKRVAFWIAWVFQNSTERTRKVFINNQTVKQLQHIILRVLFSLFWVLMSNYDQNMFWIGHSYVEKTIHLLERHAEFYQCILNLNTCTEILIYGKKTLISYVSVSTTCTQQQEMQNCNHFLDEIKSWDRPLAKNAVQRTKWPIRPFFSTYFICTEHTIIYQNAQCKTKNNKCLNCIWG